jgi:hypothetical protein
MEVALFQSLRLRREPQKHVSDLQQLTADWLTRNANIPVTLRQINQLPEHAKRRTYRSLLPPSLLVQFGIDPVSWQGPDGDGHVLIQATRDSGLVSLTVRSHPDHSDELFYLEMEDTSMNGIQVNFILIRDPAGPCFRTDRDGEGNDTLFGTVRRNLAAELEAMEAGLAPGQVCQGLRASRQALQHLEAFLVTIGHSAYFVEPLTYASAWLFERRGFAYVRGHKLMDDIHREFQPGNRLHQALDGSTPFRELDQWRTVRGRAWAIHDGILDVIGTRWDGLRMIKQVGRQAGVETFPQAVY